MHKELLARGIRVGRKRVRRLMQQHGISELDAAFRVADKIDRARGIEPLALDTLA